ncbi:MAG: sulfite exporter TauE/SafE family protein [Planctomycetota bacterium]
MIWALAGAVFIGLSLGLLGSGGSVLTVPVLIYLVGQDEKIAIAGSLGIVGAISLAAGIPYARSGLVDFRNVLMFGLPGMVGAYFGAYLSSFVAGEVQILFFALLMLVAALLMIRPHRRPATPATRLRSPLKIAAEGLIVGVVTGFVGVGGGFLIVPALVLLGGLSMHRAIGTSLFIIAMKSFAGFYKYVDVLDELGLSLDWRILGIFAAVGTVGSFVGKILASYLPQEQLRRGFAAFLVLIGAFVVYQNVPELL